MFDRFAERFKDFFDLVYQDYERWILVPAAMLLLAFGILGYSYVTTGEFVGKGIDFTGGSEIQIQTSPSVSEQQVQQAVQGELASARARTLTTEGDTQWILVETSTTFSESSSGQQPEIGPGQNSTSTGTSQIDAEQRVGQILDDNDIPYNDISIQSIGAALGDSFLFEAQLAVGIAFLIMSTVIFVAFRTLVPSLAVILAAFTDIIVALAGMSLIGIDLTLGSLAALLMLIGYSVDTDIVLSTRVLKQKHGDLKERVRDSITTGMTMTMGGVVAFIVLFTLSTSPILNEIAAVMIIGLLADAPITWLGNTVILKMHAEGRI
jgi:preprotein translocase subunit SecF